MNKHLVDKIQFVEKLAQKKGWVFPKEILYKSFQRRHLRFVYFPIRLKGGKRAFFKYTPSLSLKPNLAREKEFLLFLRKALPGLAPRLLDFGPSWTVVEFIGKGVICKGEETEPLQEEWAEWLINGLIRLQSFSGKVPHLLLQLSHHPGNYTNLARVRRRILGRSRFLAENLIDFPTREIRKFLSSLSPMTGKRGILVHGDLAPNNVVFDPAEKKVIFFDWEHGGYNPNLLVARAFDFANFYLRSWRNPPFQKALRSRFLKEKIEPKQLTLAVVLLGINQIYWLCRLRREEPFYLRRHINTLLVKIKEELALVL